MAASHLALSIVRISCLSRVPFSVSPILGDRSPVMLNSFIVVSVKKMEVFCCYERAFSAALHHEEHRAKVR